MSQPGEISLLYADFLPLLVEAEHLQGPFSTSSAGTRVWLKIGGKWRAYLITDLVETVSPTQNVREQLFTGSAVTFGNVGPGALSPGLPVHLGTGLQQNVAVNAFPQGTGVTAGTQQATTAAGVVLQLNIGITKYIVIENLGPGDVDIGPATVTFGTGYRLKNGAVLNMKIEEGNVNWFFIDNGIATATISILAFN